MRRAVRRLTLRGGPPVAVLVDALEDGHPGGEWVASLIDVEGGCRRGGHDPGLCCRLKRAAPMGLSQLPLAREGGGGTGTQKFVDQKQRNQYVLL